MTSKKKKSRHFFFSPSGIHSFIHSLSQFPIESWSLNNIIKQNKTKNHGYHPQIYIYYDDTYHYNREKKIQHIKNQKKTTNPFKLIQL